MITIFSKKTEQQIVAEIHNEFDTAEARLLQESESLLDFDNDSLLKKADQLTRLGFINSEPVTKAKKLNLVNGKEQAQLIKYYQQNYPFQKFITESELERICKKYNLIFAPVEKYTKDVPQKNINEIQNATTLKMADKIEKMVLFKYFGKSNLSKSERRLAKRGILMFWNDFTPSNNSKNLSIFFKKNVDCEYNTIKSERIDLHREGLFICAPKSNFNLDGLQKHGNFGFFNFTVIEPKDPIVFRYCRGGVQILSKWGLEASDESVINPIEN